MAWRRQPQRQRRFAGFTVVVVLLLLSICPATGGFVVSPGKRRSKKQEPKTTTTALSSSPFNPLSSLVGGIAKSVMGGTTTTKIDEAALNEALAQILPDETYSLGAIRSALHDVQTPEERAFRDNLPFGYGVAGSPLHKLRLFDNSDESDDVKVTFYRDSASWCPYCQKVWLALEEKRIPYRVEKINMRCYGEKPASFMRMQPSGQIPVANINGRVYGQSNDILLALENDPLFAQYKSLKAPAGLESTAQQLLRLERQLFGAWLSWLTSAFDPQGNRRRFEATLQEVERQLASIPGGPFFLGDQVTLVDFMYAPFLERMAASLLYYKGFQMRFAPDVVVKNDYPALNAWFDGMETLESYQLVKSDYYTHCWDLSPQLGGCVSSEGDAVQDIQDAINGKTAGSWSLPLSPHNGGLEPDWSFSSAAAAKREAVERVSANLDAIVAFAARGAGTPGFPPVTAPLADPNATPNVAVQGAVNALLRIVLVALLLQEDTTQQQETLDQAVAAMIQQGDDDDASLVDGVIKSLEYLRDRIGVPRDMKYPAARQLRAHLNWVLQSLLKR